LSQTGFDEHLAEPAELAADTLVSLGFLPVPIARKLFDGAKRPVRPNELPDTTLVKLLEYIASRYDFRFDQIRGVNKRYQALATLVHYTKLRRALLDEYGT
jgi:hypothetical protein